MGKVITGFIIGFVLSMFLFGSSDTDASKVSYKEKSILSCLEDYEYALENSNNVIYFISGEIEEYDGSFSSGVNTLQYILDTIQFGWPKEPTCESLDFI